MLQLDEKYVLHIPCYKYEDDKLVSLKDENLIDNLIEELEINGFHSLYMTDVKGYYKKRCFDEILVTIFSSKDKRPDQIFRKWFKDNNNVLKQESFAYEHNSSLIVEKL